MEEFINRSLKNLGVECIDLSNCPQVKFAPIKKHMILWMNWSKKENSSLWSDVWKVSDALEAIKFKNVKSIQLVFKIFRQKPIEKFLKEAKKRNVAVIARGPLASGLLTGNINMNSKFPENDHRNYNIDGKAFDVGDTFSGVKLEKGLFALEKLKKILPKNFSLSDLALKWILAHKEVTVVIPGAVNKKQVEMNTNVSNLDEITELLPEIKTIYENTVKADVHNRW